MSGAQAAAVATACCCSASEDGGGGNPDDCSPLSPGAESDRATTAISIALDLSVMESARVNIIDGQISQFSPPGMNCVIWNGSSCEQELPNGDVYIAYRCDGDPFRTRPTWPQTDYRGAHGAFTSSARACYNQTGNSNHVRNFVTQGTQCTCTNQGDCAGCQADTMQSQGANVIALQASSGGRSWRTYQQADEALPQHRVGEWSWRPGVRSIRQVASFSIVHNVRLFCPPPVGIFYGQNSYFSQGAQVQTDPCGKFVDVRTEVEYPYTSSRWGNADVGRIYTVADVQIDYREDYGNLGSGWLATVRLHHIVREQHLDVRHRFSMVAAPGEVARWHMQSGVPMESGYPPLVPSVQSRTTSAWPWYLWKPCLGADDTVRGIYEPIGPAQYPDDPGVRDYYNLPYIGCALAGEYRGEAELRSIAVS